MAPEATPCVARLTTAALLGSFAAYVARSHPSQGRAIAEIMWSNPRGDAIKNNELG
jgi:hypothetical protein